MIAHTVAAGHFIILHGAFQRGFYIFYRGFMEPGGIFRRKADCIYTTAVIALPYKNRGIQPGAHEHIGIHAAFFQYLGENMVMAEAVHIGTDGTQLPETIQQIPLGVQPLPDKSLSTGKDAVRLQEPASCNFPSSLRHTLPNLLKHLRKDSLYPFKKQRGGGGKFKVVKFLHPLQGRCIGSLHLLHPFLPVPEPDRIDM